MVTRNIRQVGGIAQILVAAAGGYFELSALGGGYFFNSVVCLLFGIVSPLVLLGLSGGRSGQQTGPLIVGDLFGGARSIAFSMGILIAVAAFAGLI